MTERTKFLREETLSGRNKTARCIMPPYDVSGEPGGIPIRKALGFKTICENMPLFIGPEELIVGTRTFFSPPDYSAGEINWSTPPLIAFPKYVCEEDIQCFGQDYSGSNGQHYTPDFSILLSKGIGGILKEAEARKADPALRPDQTEFLDSVLIAYTGMQTLIRRYADYAFSLAQLADEETEKLRLMEIHKVCSRISEDKPANFREAVQLLWFGHLGTHLESFYFINYGRLDVILGDFLGNTPRAEALELVECLLLKMYDQADVQDQSYIGNHEGQLVLTLGGLLPDGTSAVNDVTMLFLEAIDCTRLPEPEFNLRVSSCNPPEYLDRAARLTVSGCNFLSYYNDDTIVPALMEGGLTPEDARSYGFDLCQDINIPGKSDFYNIFGTALAYDLMTLLCERSDYESFDDLLAALKAYFAGFLRQHILKTNRAQEAMLAYGGGDHEKYFRMVGEENVEPGWDGRNPMCPLPYLSGLFHGCIEQAMDMIYEPYPIKHKGAMVGCAVEAVNSLAAIKKVVFEEKRYTLTEVVEACKADFRDQEVMRRILWNAPKWGNDDPYVDQIAKELLEDCLKEFAKYETYSGGKLLAGIHQPHPVPTGAGLMATPEGRHAGMPAAVTMTPESGTMKNGATAALKSASIFDPMLLQWNYCFMVNYYASVFSGPNGKDIFKNLLLTYFRRGGVQHQPNVMDGEELRKAQLEPEKYKDLIVRLWGVSAHFVDLNKELQDEMIARLS